MPRRLRIEIAGYCHTINGGVEQRIVFKEAPNSDKKPDEEKLKKMLLKVNDIEERNKQILKAYEQGYSQHMIAKVLGISQPAVHGVLKRDRG